MQFMGLNADPVYPRHVHEAGKYNYKVRIQPWETQESWRITVKLLS